MVMRILIDTNVLIDFFAKREPFFKNAKELVYSCMKRNFDGYIAAHSILNLFYILRHDYTVAQRRAMLTDLCSLFQVVGVDKKKLLAALTDDSFPDFEDCVQVQCAVFCEADYIITRDIKDFALSSVPFMSPNDFCQRFLDGKSENA
ncbi:MAG: PIN domain-containing protein [bacterium]|nr:PIN domain-containing protein [bacterium]